MIRKATVEDAKLLAEIGGRTFKEAYAGLLKPKVLDNYIASNFDEEGLEAELADPASTFLLAYEGDKAIGYVKLYDGRPPPAVTGPSPIELQRIYVLKENTGKGAGSTLMAASLDEAARAGFETMWLGVWEQNEKAIRFYKKWGFEAVGEQRFLLGSAVHNDLVLTRSIQQNPHL